MASTSRACKKSREESQFKGTGKRKSLRKKVSGSGAASSPAVKQVIINEEHNKFYPDSSEDDLPVIKLHGDNYLEDQNDNFLEEYFTAHSKSGKTSNHTLSKLSCPRMDVQSVKSTIATDTSFKNDISVLLEEYRSRFKYWLFLMSKGFNILLYGLGSKHGILEDFRDQVLSKSCHLLINGFFPGLTIKQVLTQLTSELLHHSAAFKTNFEHARFIVETLQTNNQSQVGTGSKAEIFIIIHNVDGQSLRGENAQVALSILAQSPFIHILASIDHINTPLLWDQKTLSNFNWTWHDTTIYNRYVDEVSYENCLLVQQTGTVGIRALVHVMQSLTPNAQSLFKLLAKNQLESAGRSYPGMSFHDCYMKCREDFLVNSDLALRTHLVEFTDHKLVKSHKGQDGVEYLLIPIDKGILAQFLEQQSAED